MTNSMIIIALALYTLQMGTTVRPMLASMTKMGVPMKSPFHVIGVFVLLPVAALFVTLGVAFAKIGEWLSIAGVRDSAYGRFAAAQLRQDLGADQDVIIAHVNGYATVETADIGNKLAALPNRNYRGTMAFNVTSR